MIMYLLWVTICFAVVSLYNLQSFFHDFVLLWVTIWWPDLFFCFGTVLAFNLARVEVGGVVNLMKITPITNLMCGASDNQATKTKCMKQL